MDCWAARSHSVPGAKPELFIVNGACSFAEYTFAKALSRAASIAYLLTYGPLYWLHQMYIHVYHLLTIQILRGILRGCNH
jgi:hypothetical protein